MSRALAALTGAIFMLTAIAPVPALAATPTTTTVEVADDVLVVGEQLQVTVTVSPAPPVDANVDLRVISGGNIYRFQHPTLVAGTVTVNFSTSDWDAGSYTVMAIFAGWPEQLDPSQSDEVPIQVDGQPSTTVLNAEPIGIATVVVPGHSFELRATVDNGNSGTVVTFTETTDGGSTALGTAPLVSESGQLPSAVLAIPAHAEGTYEFRADYPGAGGTAPSFGTLTYSVERAASAIDVTRSPATIELHQATTLTWNTTTPPSWVFAGGVSVIVRHLGSGSVVATGELDGSESVTPSTTGVHTYQAEYPGNDAYLPSVDQVSVTVGPNLVHAKGVGVESPTFFPVKDGYRDTDKILGTRQEPLSVSIRIYAGTRLVRSKSLARASGAYAWPWDGRNNSGVLLPAGKYKVVQRLVDRWGAAKSYTSYITISLRVVDYKTVTLTKQATGYVAVGREGVGRVRVLTDGSVQLTGYSGGDPGWAAVGYQFSLPDAVTYKALSVRTYAQGGTGGGTLSAQDFVACPYSSTWNYDCFTSLKTISGGPAWFQSGAAARHRHNRTVRVAIATFYLVRVYQVRVVVTYGIFR